MKWREAKKLVLGTVAGLAVIAGGCGGGSSANVVSVTVSPSGVTTIAGQVTNLTATVGGSTTLTVQWTCSYTYVQPGTSTNPTPTTSSAAACTSGQTVNGGSIGTWVTTNTNSSNVLTYTAPALSNFPSPIPTITFTAAADADKKKTGTGIVNLDSGIRASITPSSATVPVGITPAQKVTFSVSLLNVDPSTAQYALVQPNSSSTNVYDTYANPLSETCDPTCGTIDNNGVYVAPATLPSDTKPSGSKSTVPTTVYVISWSSKDPSEYTLSPGIITLVDATTNPSSFTGVYPHTIAAGGLLQDIFLDAKNLLNTTQINFVPPTAQASLTAGSGTPVSPSQVFTIPISLQYCTPTTAGTNGATVTQTCDASIMTRVRLQAAQLAQAETDANHPAWIMMPNLPGSLTTTAPCVVVGGSGGSTTAIACPLHVKNANPALVSAVPYSFPQVSGAGTISIGAIGGYYGSTGGLVNLEFDGQATIVDSTKSGPRSIFGVKDNDQLPNPGLYEVSLHSSITQGAPPQFPTVSTNAAVQPNFAVVPTPASVPLNTSGASGTNLAPSAMALDSVKGFALIAEQASATLQFVSLGSNGPTQVGNPFAMGGTAASPTDIALDTALDAPNNGSDLAVVVSSGDSTLYLYSVTSNGAINPITTIPVDLNTLLGQPSATGLPTPVSFGVDPSTHLGVVAYQNTNIGFIVDVNPNLDGLDTRKCFLTGKVAPCVVAPVSINTGTWPKVVMQPNVPLAYVTPGGGYGTISVVNLLQTGTSVSILPYSATGTSGATRTANVTLVHTQSPHGINPILGGTVIISGIQSTLDPSVSNFNGTFNVIPGSVTDPYTFSYYNPGTDDVEKNASGMQGTVQYGTAYYSFNTSANASGAAINPVTRTFGFADFNATSSQIGFIGTLDQSLTSLTLSAGSCNGCTPTPSGAPESGFRSVAFDPFTNVLIAFNPSENTGTNFAGNEISLINPGGPAPNGSTNFPYRIIAGIDTGQVGTGSYTPAGQSAAVSVYGPMTYDPKTKFVLVANAGSNTLTYMNIDPGGNFQRAHIQDLRLPTNSCPDAATCYAVPVAQPTLGSLAPATTCSFTNPAQPCMPQAVQEGKTATIRLLGQGFSSLSSPAVRLDGLTSVQPPNGASPVPITTTYVNDSEIDATIPAAALYTPHDFSVDVQSAGGGDITNEIDLHVVGLLNLSNACQPTSTHPQGPEGVAVDTSRHVALITNYACNSVSVIAVDPNGYTKTDGSTAPFGTLLGSVTVGNQPIGIGVIPRLGYAVVANSGDTPSGTASIIDYSKPETPTIVTWTPSGSTTSANTVTVGLSPLGVAIDQDRALALVANQGSNTLSAIDLTVLLPGAITSTTPQATTVALSGPPIAIAVDPNRAIAVVTNLQNSGTTSVGGGLDVVSLASTPPIKSSTASVSSITASPTGIVYDPGDPNSTSSTTTGVFYATSTLANAIYAFNPSIGSAQTIRVGFNPYSLGFNYQTGTLLTINSTSNTASVVDTQNFKTRQTLGISSMSQFAIGVDNVTNIAVIADQNNNRVVFLAMPK
ncbi:MAG TPA: hypothetical protein VL128_05210 [Candidatus Eisenbacteria bacterium]|nr:hypothetical protein [Candidatus Eisenbacteria bacterium]